jgi:hypothetical protein
VLRDKLSLVRAVETGTYLGDGARELAQIFQSVVSIELSEELHHRAIENLANATNVRLVAGDSRSELPAIVRDAVPTFYWLDAHWSNPDSAGEGNECPVI